MPMQLRSQWIRRSGLTLIEIIVGIALMALIAASLSAMSQHALRVNETVERVNQSHQLISVVERKIVSILQSRVVTENFDGIFLAETATGQQGLLIRTNGTSSVPYESEIGIVTFDPNAPNQLCLYRSSNSKKISGQAATSVWNKFFESAIQDSTSDKRVLTTQLATTDSVAGRVGVFSWTSQVKPSEAELADFKSGLLTWDELAWPQDKFTLSTGTQRTTANGLMFLVDDGGYPVPLHISTSYSLQLQP